MYLLLDQVCHSQHICLNSNIKFKCWHEILPAKITFETKSYVELNKVHNVVFVKPLLFLTTNIWHQFLEPFGYTPKLHSFTFIGETYLPVIT